MANVYAHDVVLGHDEPAVRRIGVSDLREALRRGWADFMATPTQLIFLGVIYVLIGLVEARIAAEGELLPLFYPIVAGLSIMGPFVALGIYELSRRREKGLSVSWVNIFDVRRSHSIGAIIGLGLMLAIIFLAWLLAAQVVYEITMGGLPQPDSLGGLLSLVMSTPEGWNLILLGNAVGFLFAVLVLVLTVVSFPLLLDRDVTLRTAVRTSIRACLVNPVTMALWGLTVAGLLFLGCLPIFVGLAVVMPLLGHATWHLYRRVVVFH
jgi:uncharacterized membrane protein